MVGGEKSIGRALLQVGFPSYLGSHNLQTQAMLMEKMGPPVTILHGRL